MKQLLVAAIAVLLLTTWGCKNKVGENVELDYLVKGDIEIVQNPSGKAPLTALAKINSKANVTVEVTVEGDEPVHYDATDFERNPDVPIIGLYPDAVNTVKLKLTDLDENWAETTIEIETDSIPAHFPDVEVNTVETNMMAPGLTLCGFSYGQGSNFLSNPFLVDKSGTIRWYLSLDDLGGISFPIRVKDDGKLWIGSGSSLFEVDWLGREHTAINIPGYWQHHEIQELPNGNLIVAVNKESIGTVDDHIIEVDRAGNVLTEWDLRQILDVDRFDLVEDSIDWYHMNAIFYDEDDEALIVSGKNQGLIKVDWDNNLQWILAPHKGWGKAGSNGNGHETSDFLLTAVDQSGNPYANDVQQGDLEHPEFDWPWGQHAPMILPNGNLFVYDNGSTRQFTKPASYSRAVEYSIDEDNQTLRQVWQYGKERGEELQSIIISDVDLLANDNRMMTSGIVFSNNVHRAKVVEMQYPSKNEVFEMTLYFKHANSSGTLSWGDFDLVYRAERVDFESLAIPN